MPKYEMSLGTLYCDGRAICAGSLDLAGFFVADSHTVTWGYNERGDSSFLSYNDFSGYGFAAISDRTQQYLPMMHNVGGRVLASSSVPSFPIWIADGAVMSQVHCLFQDSRPVHLVTIRKQYIFIVLQEGWAQGDIDSTLICLNPDWAVRWRIKQFPSKDYIFPSVSEWDAYQGEIWVWTEGKVYLCDADTGAVTEKILDKSS